MPWTKTAKPTGVWEAVRMLSYLLQENGDYLLQEDGDRIALEWHWDKGSKSSGSWTKVAKSTA